MNDHITEEPEMNAPLPNPAMGLAAIGVGLGLLALNHAIYVFGDRIYPVLILAGGFGLFGGALFIVSPRTALLAFDQSNSTTTRDQLVVGAMIIAGLLFGVAIWVFGYDTQSTVAFREFLRDLLA